MINHPRKGYVFEAITGVFKAITNMLKKSGIYLINKLNALKI